MSGVDLDKISKKLRKSLVGWLTTVTPEGQPQSSVVWFLRQGDDLLIYSKPNTQKLRNIAANPKVAFNLPGDSIGHDIVTLEGDATIDADPIPSHEIAEYVEKYRERIAAYRWTPESFARNYSVLVRVAVTRVRKT